MSQNDTKMNRQIIEKFKRLRIAKGLNQTEMAERLNVSRATYQKLESGNNYAWAKYLDELLTILETNPKDFFSDIGNKVVQQHNYEGSIGYVVEHLHQFNKDLYEKLQESYDQIIRTKDEQIALLKGLLDKK